MNKKTPKKAAKKVAAPKFPKFYVLNTDCENFEGKFDSIQEALDDIKSSYEDEATFIIEDYIEVLEVVKVHKIKVGLHIVE